VNCEILNSLDGLSCIKSRTGRFFLHMHHIYIGLDGPRARTNKKLIAKSLICKHGFSNLNAVTTEVHGNFA
jgi:hypothetical protein